MTIDERALEIASKAQYESYFESVIGCCEPGWDETSESYKHRLIESTRKAIEAYEAAKPSPWRPIAEIMKAVNWYVIFNDLAFLKYMKYVKRDDKEYWDYVIENYPRAQFMVVNFGEQS